MHCLQIQKSVEYYHDGFDYSYDRCPEIRQLMRKKFVSGRRSVINRLSYSSRFVYIKVSKRHIHKPLKGRFLYVYYRVTASIAEVWSDRVFAVLIAYALDRGCQCFGVEHHLHHAYLLFPSGGITLGANDGVEDVIYGESQRDSGERACISQMRRWNGESLPAARTA